MERGIAEFACEPRPKGDIRLARFNGAKDRHALVMDIAILKFERSKTVPAFLRNPCNC